MAFRRTSPTPSANTFTNVGAQLYNDGTYFFLPSDPNP